MGFYGRGGTLNKTATALTAKLAGAKGGSLKSGELAKLARKGMIKRTKIAQVRPKPQHRENRCDFPQSCINHTLRGTNFGYY